MPISVAPFLIAPGDIDRTSKPQSCPSDAQEPPSEYPSYLNPCLLRNLSCFACHTSAQQATPGERTHACIRMPGLKEVANKTEQTSERIQHTASAQESIAGELLQEWHTKPDRGGAWPQGLDTRHAGQRQHQLLPASIRWMYGRAEHER